jgi:ABC-type transport system involved in multi-copper enzyme maturation permease subunit
MNPFLKKEIRLLLPSCLIGVALTFVNWFAPSNSNDFVRMFLSALPFLFCPAMVVMLALDSFGVEISSGTFTSLLAQPISREQIWRTKSMLLLAAIVIILVAWWISFFLNASIRFVASVGDVYDVMLGTSMFALVVYSGGLWTVLLLRQVAAAFWFTLIVPAALLTISSFFLQDSSNGIIEVVAIIVLTAYCIAGYFFARWLFLRAQDVAWTGGTVTLPEWKSARRLLTDSGAKRIWRPRAALLVKEFQLHQSQFVLAGALLVLHLGVLAVKKLSHIKQNSALELVVEIFWGLWLVLPMLVGAAAVAEERKLGTLEGQLCLPVKRRTQFAIKFSTVLFLSVLFGVVMPLLLEGTRIFPDLHLAIGFHSVMSQSLFFFWNHSFLLGFLMLTTFAAFIGAISFYASTFARNTLQALGPAVLGILVTGFVLVAAYLPERFVNDPLWRGWLVYFIGVPIVTLTIIRLTFWNYKHVVVGWRMVGWNISVLAAALALVTTVTTAVYHRAWEKLTLFEPPHGTARFTLSNPPTLIEEWNISTVRLPDGKIWTDDYTYNYPVNTSAPNPVAWLLGDIGLMPLAGGHFLDGSNWVSVIHAAGQEQVGIKADGTLWVSENPTRRERSANGGWKMTKAGDLARFGSETNWSSLAWNGLSMLLVKNDGTLWRWGVTNWDYKLHEWPGFRAFTPYRLGTESNWAEVYWAEVFLLGYEPCLRKTDGSVWTPLNNSRWNPLIGYPEQALELEPGFSVERATPLEHGKWRSTTSTWSGLGYRLGVSADGTFRIWADQRLNNQSRSYEWTAVDLQFGKDTNWLAVAGEGGNRNEKIVTLKNDGTLWLWNFNHDDRRGDDAERDEHEMLDVKPVRLGTHSDWIAVAGADGGIISLAADGSFWYWPLGRPSELEHFYDYGNGNNSHFEPLLDMSRKPQLLGNIFGNNHEVAAIREIKGQP